MKKCWYSYDRKVVAIIAVLIYMCGVLVHIYCGLHMIFDNKTEWPLSIKLIVFFGAMFWLVYILRNCIISSREFLISETGFTIRYLKKYNVSFPWEKVKSVIVCDIDGPIRTWRTIVLRISLIEEKKGPFSKSSSDWRKVRYIQKHCKEVIHLEYSEERYCLLKSNYPGKIVKFFSKPSYAENCKNPTMFPK